VGVLCVHGRAATWQVVGLVFFGVLCAWALAQLSRSSCGPRAAFGSLWLQQVGCFAGGVSCDVDGATHFTGGDLGGTPGKHAAWSTGGELLLWGSPGPAGVSSAHSHVSPAG
jgi:hypothetical protein